MKKLITTITIIASLGLHTAHANPQTTTNSTVSTSSQPSQESAIKLIQIMQIEQNFANMQASLRPQITKALDQTMNQTIAQGKKPLTTKQQTQLKNLVQKYIQEEMHAIFTPEYQQQVLAISIKVTQDTYTQAEVDAMIAFYDSEIGQSVIKKQTPYATTLMNEIIPLTMKSVNQQQSKDRKEKFFRDIERIMSSK